jgi:hypothetical protein
MQGTNAVMARGDEAKRRKQEEANRYRKAADDALQQLDWVIIYLHGLHKGKIAQALARNRSFITAGADRRRRVAGAERADEADVRHQGDRFTEWGYEPDLAGVLVILVVAVAHGLFTRRAVGMSETRYEGRRAPPRREGPAEVSGAGVETCVRGPDRIGRDPTGPGRPHAKP